MSGRRIVVVLVGRGHVGWSGEPVLVFWRCVVWEIAREVEEVVVGVGRGSQRPRERRASVTMRSTPM